MIEIGKKYGMLTVLEDLNKKNARGYKLYKCRCDCSNICEKSSTDLVRIKRPSCGCIGRCYQFITHNMSRTPEYHSWFGMKQRCLNPNNKKYPIYGGRGIKVCQRWLDDFMNFYNDMGPKPGKNYSIDRIDNNGDYCPENCHWASPDEQMQNRSITKLTPEDVFKIREEFQNESNTGKPQKIIKEDLAEKFNCSPSMIRLIVKHLSWKNIQ